MSYARDDRLEVDRIVADLNSLGHQTWFDDQLLGGTDWWAEILRRIRGADVLLFVLSPKSTVSSACLAELQYANDTHRRLLPVMVSWTSPATLPATLSHAQFIDYAKVGWKGLSAALLQMPPPLPLPQPLPLPPSLPEPALARLHRRVLAPEGLSRGNQHEMIDDIVREGRQPGQAAVAYDAIGMLSNRADLFADVGGRLQATREELWKLVPASEKKGRPGPWETTPAWSWPYVAGICALSFFTVGVLPLVLGLRNKDRPHRRVQAWIMIAAAAAYFVLLIVVGIVGAATAPPPE